MKNNFNWDRGEFNKQFSVINMGPDGPLPVIGRFLEGKKAGENYIGYVPTKELGDYIESLLSRQREEVEQGVLGEVRDKAEELMPHWSEVNYEEDNFAAGKRKGLEEIIALLPTPKEKECEHCEGSGEGIDRGAAADGYESYCRHCNGEGKAQMKTNYT